MGVKYTETLIFSPIMQAFLKKWDFKCPVTGKGISFQLNKPTPNPPTKNKIKRK